MKTRKCQQHGLALIVVIFVMTIVGGLLTFLAMNRTYYYRSCQVNRLHNVAHAMADSAADYARINFKTWKVDPPTEPIELDMKQLLLPKMTGSATVNCLDKNGRKICRISVKATRASISVVDEIDIEIN